MRPRYFVASTSSPAGPPDRDDPSSFVNVLALVRLGPTELLVGSDSQGRLRGAALGDRAALPSRVQAQLAYHEVAAPEGALEVRATELYLFDVQMVELLRDAPGLNDPLYLYGALRGPYPGSLDRETSSIDGQLTVARADLLAGLVAGVERAFRYEPTSSGTRCVHAVVPGEPASEIREGRGAILAFPLAHLPLGDEPQNELLVAQTLYDVLSALRADLGDKSSAPLPVPSRRAYEAELAAEGWRIDGDMAIRKKGGIGGRLLGVGKERRRLPAQGTLEDYVAEARAVLARLGTTAGAGASAPPMAPVSRAPVAPTAPAPRPRVRTPRSEWMEDFAVTSERASPTKRSQLSRPARVVSRAATMAPEWMRDFERSEPDRTPPQPRTDSSDWSKDFD